MSDHYSLKRVEPEERTPGLSGIRKKNQPWREGQATDPETRNQEDVNVDSAMLTPLPCNNNKTGLSNTELLLEQVISQLSSLNASMTVMSVRMDSLGR